MTPHDSLALAGLGFGAGLLGALTGVGGGILLVPVLTAHFGLPMQAAVGASLACVIATSSAAAASYVQERLTDLRLGMRLELATGAGGLAGALAAVRADPAALKLLLGAFLLYSAGLLWFRREPPETGARTRVRNLPLGLAVSFAAGGLSGMLGVGGGPIKVPLMHLWMGVPFKTASATSNFMIGVTAAASAFVYFGRGLVPPLLAASLAVGVLAGARLGAAWMPRLPSAFLRRLFVLLLLYLAALTLRDALGGAP